MLPNYSILLSVYYKENPAWFKEAIESMLNQTVKFDDFVIVCDGRLTEELYDVLHCYSDNPENHINVVQLEENGGLGNALNIGLQHCKNEIVARMDSDDISKPERCEKQLSYMQKHPEIVLCSGYINEFKDNPENIVSCRKVPLSHDEIKKYLKKRNAFNHMSVCFKKSAVEKAGGYQQVSFFEDYDLWIRIVQNGFVTGNMGEVLVNARIGNNMIGRRYGIGYAGFEISFLKRQLRSGFLSKNDFLKLVVLRVPVRLLPKVVLKIIYGILHR